MPEAPPPVFIQENEFDKYLNLDGSETKIGKYDKAEVEFYDNMDNQNWDEITAELVRNSTLQNMFAGQGGNQGQGQGQGQGRQQNDNMAVINPAFFLH